MPTEAETMLWMGTPISDLSREDLERAFVEVATRYSEMLSPRMSRAIALGKVEMLRRGEYRADRG